MWLEWHERAARRLSKPRGELNRYRVVCYGLCLVLTVAEVWRMAECAGIGFPNLTVSVHANQLGKGEEKTAAKEKRANERRLGILRLSRLKDRVATPESDGMAHDESTRSGRENGSSRSIRIIQPTRQTGQS